MLFECPKCSAKVTPQELRTEWGGGVTCPACSASLRYWPPYHFIVMWITLPALCWLIITRGIAQGLVFCLRLVVLWIMGWLVLSLILSWIKPPKLKLARRDGDPPIQLFGNKYPR
jgi:hypothetical protein